jgi:hypothetical protein
MASFHPPMTIDELYDNYQYKVIKKALMREYPWIKDVWVKQDELDKYNLIFLNIEIDPYMLGEERGWTMTPWIKAAYENGKNYNGMYLSLFYDKVDQDESRGLQNDLSVLANSVGTSPAFPKDLLIPQVTGLQRTFSIGDIHVNRNGAPWFS